MWEYLVFEFPQWENACAAQMEVLDRLGHDRWELVQVTLPRVFMKRPRKAQEESKDE
jgi:hypothetical protein